MIIGPGFFIKEEILLLIQKFYILQSQLSTSFVTTTNFFLYFYIFVFLDFCIIVSIDYNH